MCLDQVYIQSLALLFTWAGICFAGAVDSSAISLAGMQSNTKQEIVYSADAVDSSAGMQSNTNQEKSILC